MSEGGLNVTLTIRLLMHGKVRGSHRGAALTDPSPTCPAPHTASQLREQPVGRVARCSCSLSFLPLNPVLLLGTVFTSLWGWAELSSRFLMSAPLFLAFSLCRKLEASLGR